jgi:hypothetical protein
MEEVCQNQTVTEHSPLETVWKGLFKLHSLDWISGDEKDNR